MIHIPQRRLNTGEADESFAAFPSFSVIDHNLLHCNHLCSYVRQSKQLRLASLNYFFYLGHLEIMKENKDQRKANISRMQNEQKSFPVALASNDYYYLKKTSTLTAKNNI